MKIRNKRFLSLLLLTALVCLVTLSASANPDEGAAADDTLAPSWLEPRPLSVVDLISGGLDPSLMAGSPLVWQPGQALLQYTSGSKSGNTVKVNAKMLPVQTSNAFCLGQDGIRDQWPIVVPESHVRITSNGSDITGQIDWVQYFPAGQEKPNRGSSDGPARYPERSMHGSELNYDSQGRIVIPANMGCKIYFKNGAGNGGNINLEFEHTLTQYISVSVVSSFENTFKSYYFNGDQNFGQLSALNRQISAYKGGFSRHDLVKQVPPASAEYTLMVFPPTQLDMYASLDDLRSIKPFPGTGTYRISAPANNQSSRNLSVDWFTMAGLPLKFHAQDSDLDSGATYLDYFTSSDGEYSFMSLEVLALNNQYQECMHQGTCSDSVLETVSKTRMDVEIYYLKVDRIAPGLTQIPLCSVGKSWTTSNTGQQCSHVAPTAIIQNEFTNFERNSAPTAVQMDSFIYLPFVTRPVALEEDNPNANCPCGWFTEDGRMLDHVLPPGW